jgi:hypothetical protein
MKYWNKLEAKDNAATKWGIAWGLFGLIVAIYLFTHGETNAPNGQDFADWFVTPLLIFFFFSIMGPIFGLAAHEWLQQPISNKPEEEQNPESESESERYSSCDLTPQLKERVYNEQPEK